MSRCHRLARRQASFFLGAPLAATAGPPPLGCFTSASTSRPLIAKCPVDSHLSVHPAVPHSESLENRPDVQNGRWRGSPPTLNGHLRLPDTAHHEPSHGKPLPLWDIH